MAKKNKKDFNYFEYFRSVGDIVVEAAEYLNKIICEFDYSSFPEKMDEMHKIENRADAAKHEMIEHLAHEFITPIEREDIIDLSHNIDNVVDCIDDVARCIYMYNVKEIRSGATEFTALIVSACTALKSAIDEFENFKTTKSIKSMVVEVNNFENKGDQLHSHSLRSLYSDGSSDRDVIIWTNVFEDLEDCLDAAESCVDIIESVIMKNT